MTGLLLVLQLVVLGTSVPGSVPAACKAINQSGATGGAKIQAAIDDPACGTVEIAATGPDAGGYWNLTTDLLLRSNLIIRGDDTGVKPTLKAVTPGPTAGMFRSRSGVSLSNVVIRGLAFDGNSALGSSEAPNALWIAGGCDHLTFVQNTTLDLRFHGVHLNTLPCSDVLIAESTFTNSTLIGVRVDTVAAASYHARVIVRNNTFTGTQNYGVALDQCGTSTLTACEVRQNIVAGPTLSGVDFNRVHYGVIYGNTVTAAAKRGITIDDATHNTITYNSVTAAVSGTDYGMVFANGASPVSYQPWYVTFNTASYNQITGFATYGICNCNDADSGSINDSNTFTFNVFASNGAACHDSPTYATNSTWTDNSGQACSP